MQLKNDLRALVNNKTDGFEQEDNRRSSNQYSSHRKRCREEIEDDTDGNNDSARSKLLPPTRRYELTDKSMRAYIIQRGSTVTMKELTEVSKFIELYSNKNNHLIHLF